MVAFAQRWPVFDLTNLHLFISEYEVQYHQCLFDPSVGLRADVDRNLALMNRFSALSLPQFAEQDDQLMDLKLRSPTRQM